MKKRPLITFHVVTIFPNLVEPYLSDSIIGRAIKNNKIKVVFYDPRQYVVGKYKKKWPDGNVSRIVDDRPYGGGPGMVLRAEPILKAIEKSLKTTSNNKKAKIIILSATGTSFSTSYAKQVTKKYTDIILVSGRYEGIDARVKKIFKAEDVSIGDYVLTGGELPALVLIDSISRQIEGVLGNFDSREEERVSTSEIYTRPEIIDYKGKKYKVPEVLLSGNHKDINLWKEKTKKKQQ